MHLIERRCPRRDSLVSLTRRGFLRHSDGLLLRHNGLLLLESVKDDASLMLSVHGRTLTWTEAEFADAAAGMAWSSALRAAAARRTLLAAAPPTTVALLF